MIGLGTLINTAGIILGGLSGHFFGRFLKERHQSSLTTACGVSVLFIGTAGAMQGMLAIEDGGISSGRAMLVTICLAFGTLVGAIQDGILGDWSVLTITVFATFLKPIMTDLAMEYLSLVGSILIFCVGLNLVWGKKVRVANMLPAVALAVLAAFIPW